MKAIFLDIDGVLNCDATPNPRELPYIVDKKLRNRFQRLVKRSGAKVVLTSSWRIDPIGLYAARHWKIPFDGVCPDMPEAPRRDEILAWLKTHRRVTRFAVLDDDDDQLDALPLFQPSGKTGLTREIAAGLVAYLEGKTNHDMRASFASRAIENVTAIFHRNKN
jgi:hypothetical protein